MFETIWKLTNYTLNFCVFVRYDDTKPDIWKYAVISTMPLSSKFSLLHDYNSDRTRAIERAEQLYEQAVKEFGNGDN